MNSINNTFSSDYKGRFKICNNRGVYKEVARYFRKVYNVCCGCHDCSYCYAFNFVLGQLTFYRIELFPNNIWKVFINTNIVGFEMVWFERI